MNSPGRGTGDTGHSGWCGGLELSGKMAFRKGKKTKVTEISGPDSIGTDRSRPKRDAWVSVCLKVNCERTRRKITVFLKINYIPYRYLKFLSKTFK